MNINFMKNLSFAGICLALVMFLGGCGTIGQNFNYDNVGKIVKNQTTKEEIRRLFGPPISKGMENGRDRWTYQYSKKYVGGKDYNKELVLIFDDNGKVLAFSHESNFPPEEQ